MKSILNLLRESPSVQLAKDTSNRPVHLWGMNRSAVPGLAEAVRNPDSRFLLVITNSDARAEQLRQDFRFYDRNTFVYPSKDTLFYYADIHGNVTAARRLEIVKRIYKNEPAVVLMSVDGLMDRLPDMKYFAAHSFTLHTGDTVDPEQIRENLVMIGYQNAAMVEAGGQFSVRGDILDIFPLSGECPVRVELFGDEIESIREFDVESQRSIGDLPEIEIFPASEYVLSDARIERGLRKIEEDGEKEAEVFRKNFHTEQFARLKDTVQRMTDEIRSFRSTSGLDSLIRYFYSTTVSFLDYLPAGTEIMIDEPLKVEQRAKDHEEEFKASMQGRLEGGYILKEQAQVLYPWQEVLERLRNQKPVLFSEIYEKSEAFGEKTAAQFDSVAVASVKGDFEALTREITDWANRRNRILIVTPSQTRGKRLAKDLREENLPASFTSGESKTLKAGEILVTEGSLPEGSQMRDISLVLISESEIVDERKEKDQKKRRRSKKYTGEVLNSLSDLSVGDYVVHEHYGIGIYKGIRQIEIEGSYRDFITIDYADDTTISVPVEHMDRVEKYADKDAEKPKLNRIGGKEWDRTRKRVRDQVDGVAKELVDLYAIRQNRKGHRFQPDDVWQKEFEEMFPYDETPDQLRAIEDTKSDMESDRIMDRLICGDVGFGKTEVAIRAAFKCVQDSRQVAYLVPTTVLAEQHYHTFQERMKNYPVTVRMLSRFCTSKEIRETIEGLKNGKVDIVIGTHRLLSRDVAFRSLGLLIIDEEQRFGVKAKETIKEFKKTVDVLTLTATPIPRTLHMSLVGIRDMSLLEEPPVDRRPIQTYVMSYDREIVREAIRRELKRDGQVYYVYNRVDHIEDITEELRQMLPGARIEYAHGKMKERDLENIMHAFVRHEIDVLVSTTIIETGLDIPNVNTIIIHDADRFGLAQLYQLRGRVGRSDRDAYAFLMIQKGKLVRDEAEKRLEAIREFTDLGSGYKISMRDLEIRGAGNLLGRSQSGHMEEVGYDMYVKMLNQAIRREKGEEPEEEFVTSLEIPVDIYIPDTYVKNEFLKLSLYKEIARVQNAEDAEEVIAEAKDRFGDPPKAFLQLVRASRLRAAAHEAEIERIHEENQVVDIFFHEKAKIHVENVPYFLEKYPNVHMLRGKKAGFSVLEKGKSQEQLLDELEFLVSEIDRLLIHVTEDTKKQIEQEMKASAEARTARRLQALKKSGKVSDRRRNA